MFKRIGALAMMMAGGMAVLTPAVAQAQDRGDYRRYERHDDRREWREPQHRANEWREHEWREHERFDRRWDRPVYRPIYAPVYYDRFGRRICR